MEPTGGFVKRNGAYSLAPTFDNGSCLFPALVDEDEMERVMESEDETAKRVYGFPTSQIRLRGGKLVLRRRVQLGIRRV